MITITSQVAIINKNTSINVSDRNGTNENDKSYGGHTKIIKLMNDPPVSVMYNGNIEFEGISIEDLVHEFKKQIDLKKLKTVKNIKNEFLKFLSGQTEYTSLEDYLTPIIEDFKKEITAEISKSSFEEVLRYYKKNQIPSFLKQLPNFKSMFQDLIPNDNYVRDNQTIWEMFSWYLSFEGSNLIFSGANQENYYHSLFETNIHCNDNGKIIYYNVEELEFLKKPFIKIFAQNREAYTYITGIDEDFMDFISMYHEELDYDILDDFNSYLNKINIQNQEDIIEKLRILLENKHAFLNQELETYRQEGLNNTSYYMEYLPHDILCFFGDFLVKSVALKQRISDEIDSVSIETDICVMSNSKGFLWLNRK